MISIIICTRSKQLSPSLSDNIQQTIGCEYELIVIDNSQQQFSIFSAYNLGIEKSNYPNLCFVHDDVEFQTQGWGLKLIDHLNKPNAGLIGIAGGQAMLRIPLGWTAFNPHYNITHAQKNQSETIINEKETFPRQHENAVSVVLIDGVFMCARKEIFNRIKFDERFHKFHGYDLDISIQAIKAGFQNFVVYDIDLVHFSKGNFDTHYISALVRVQEKWQQKLPIFERSFTYDTISEVIHKAENSALLRLRKRMVRAGMSNTPILHILRTYILRTKMKKEKFWLFLLPVELSAIRFISRIRKKMLYQKKSQV